MLRINARIKEHPEPIDRNKVRAFLEWFEKFENSIDAADSWFETSGKGHLAYVDCPGELLNKWHSGGYFSALKMLIVCLIHQIYNSSSDTRSFFLSIDLYDVPIA